MRRFLHRLIQLVYLLLVATIFWISWYASSHGFSRKWRFFVTREFHKRGVEVTMRRLTLDPFHGLVAREVTIVDPRSPAKQFAAIDRVALDLNYSNLWRGEPFLNAVDLRDADLALPLDPGDPDSARVEISQLNARILLPPNQLYVSEAEAKIYGLQISARGRLLHPEAAWRRGPAVSKAQAAQKRESIVNLLNELRRIRYLSEPPRIEIEFSGDAAEPQTLFAEATVWGQKMSRGSYTLENLFATLRYREGVASVTRCTMSDARGSLDASGSCDVAARRGEWQMRSSLDLQALAHTLRVPHALDEFVFYEPLSFELSGETKWEGKPQIKLLGHAALKKFAVKSTVFEGASANFSYDGSRWYVRDFSLRNRTGAVTCNALSRPGDFHANLRSTLNPRSLLPLLSGKAAELLGEWDFLQAPQVNLDVTGPAPDLAQCEVRGDLQLGRTRIRGVALNAASARLNVKDQIASYENFKIEREEGVGTGTFRYDFGRHEAHFEKILTTLNPGDVATWIDAGLVDDIAPYRFHIAPNLTLNGLVGNHRTNLEVLVDAPGGMDYVFLKKTLSFPKINGKLLFTEGRLRISDLAGSLYAGWLRGSADISLQRDAPGYAAKLTAGNVDFASLTKLYFHYENSHGKMNGAFDFRGKNSDSRTLQGHGQIAVLDGDVFAIPVLGPFSGILNSIVPNMGYSLARKASASFDVRDGVISTQDFAVNGTGFDMLGAGQLFFLDDKIDFTIRLNAQGLPGVLLFPVSKLFEYVSDGSLSKPAWRPKRLPAL